MKKCLFLILLIILILFAYNIDFNKEEEIDSCITLYEPVCGKIQVQCITTPCNPVEQTFSNMCEANKVNAFDIKQGECSIN
ncbi:hypothetical protein HOK68_00740 [Candidatus Woesearchaeota archaeon]|jgi:hypothetical protein|nr:hypothetical protein [Candidatus Woesearchaeota archaeon]MBT4387034.1 hypothetical protein [Candidatus Woesearchaeota archaeon]MBT4595916.1 hypothetical protein [Candidatus Woesearchaeota archaeon]MBT5741046.1 hypothetical protein [Candidatus Woesearchaeota archaeon]MBT6505287.1 hypothetical protein [Candidatus Woesearchaeota archaeon]